MNYPTEVVTLVNSTRQVALRAHVQYIQIEAGLNVVKIDLTSDASDLGRYAPLITPYSRQGFCTTRALEKYMTRKSTLPEFCNLSLVGEDFLNLVASRGFSRGIELSADHESRPFDAFAFSRGNVDKDRIVRVEHVSHMVFDRQDNPLPVGVVFDYVLGGMDNSKFDLGKAFEILRDNPQVHPLSTKPRVVPDVIPKSDWGISPIPAYNCDDDRTEQLSFVFQPTFYQMQEIWKICKRESYPSTRIRQAVMELDLLGLFGQGAAKYPLQDMYFG